MTPLRQDIQLRVLKVVAETFPGQIAVLDASTMIKRDLGADSMQLIALMIGLDEEFDAEFAVDQIPKDDVSLDWVCEFVEATLLAARSTSKLP